MFRYDKDMDGKLSFNEFKEALLPLDPNYRDIVLRRPSYCSNMDYARLNFFLDTTTNKLKRTIQLLVQTEMRAERMRQSLARRKNFDIDKAFEAIAVAVKDKATTGDDGTITKDDISSFLINRNYAPTNRQVSLFFKRLDRYETGEPRLQDWKQEMLPRTSESV